MSETPTPTSTIPPTSACRFIRLIRLIFGQGPVTQHGAQPKLGRGGAQD